LCGFSDDRGAGRSCCSSRRRAEGGRDVRTAVQPEPLRDSLPACDGSAAGDAFAPPNQVRRDAVARRDDLPPAASAGLTPGIATTRRYVQTTIPRRPGTAFESASDPASVSTTRNAGRAHRTLTWRRARGGAALEVESE